MGGCREDAGAVEEGGMHGEGKALRRKAFSARLEVDVMVYWILERGILETFVHHI